MKATVKNSFTVETPMSESLWPTVRLCAKCWKVRVQDKQVCAECEAKGLSPDSKAVDVSYPNINHVVVKEY